jgi:hypothetical protein
MNTKFFKFISINLFIIIVTILILIFNIDDELKSQQSTYYESSMSITTSEQRKNKSPNQIVGMHDKYTPDITIRNNYPDSYLYRIFFLLDYKHTEVLYSGQLKKYIDINLKPYSEESFKIQVPHMKEGLHDMVAVAIRDPDIPRNEKSVSPQLSTLMKRTPVIVGNEKEPSILYSEVDRQSAINSGYFFVSEQPSTDKQKSSYIVSYNKKTNMWLNIPVSSPNTKFALFAILDNKQVIMHEPFFSSAKTGTIHLPIKIPKQEGNFILGLVESPYTKLKKPDEYDVFFPRITRWTNITITQ